MSGFETIGAFLMNAAPYIAGGAEILGGVAENRNARFEAQQLDAKAKEEIAASQREAQDKRKEAALVNSRAQAIAAASGGGAGVDAPSIVKIMSDTAGQGEYNAQAAMYGGATRAAGLRASAAARRRSGSASLLGSVASGFGRAATGFGSNPFARSSASSDPSAGLR